jgi:hypothetical protein
MKIVRLLILDKEEARERLVRLGADVSEGLTADQLENLYSECTLPIWDLSHLSLIAFRVPGRRHEYPATMP